MKDDMRYNPSDCFETFPFPENFESAPLLEGAGKVYYEFRATLRMDRAVLDAYGGDLAELTVPPCEFLLDFEEEEDEDEQPSGRQRKKPWRYRWPDAFRDEVLALLLELNRQRAEQEQFAGAAGKKQARSRGSRTKAADKGPNLYG
jgi:hypothetical protein